jgi:hypothetical protein
MDIHDLFFFTYYGTKIKVNKMDGNCRKHQGKANACKILFRNPERKNTFGRLRRNWENNH